MKKVLMIAPERNARGGISSVLRLYEETGFWSEFNCRWVATYADGKNLYKVLFLLKALFLFITLLPSSSLVHIHLSEKNSALRKYLFFRLSKLLGRKTIVHFHSFSAETTLNSKYGSLYRKLFKNADAVVVLSDYWKRQVTTFLGDESKIFVIHNPSSGIEERPKTFEKKKYILFAGTLNDRKGYKDLIMAFSDVAKMNPEWSVVFAGNGEIESGKKIASSFQIHDRIIFKGWISGNEKNRLFSEASIFCLPSYAEGFPMSVIEAWSYGLPVITTNVGGLADIIKHRENALIFSPGNIEDLSKCISDLISDEELRRSLSRNSKDLVENSFNTEVITGQVANLYKRILN